MFLRVAVGDQIRFPYSTDPDAIWTVTHVQSGNSETDYEEEGKDTIWIEVLNTAQGWITADSHRPAWVYNTGQDQGPLDETPW